MIDIDVTKTKTDDQTRCRDSYLKLSRSPTYCNGQSTGVSDGATLTITTPADGAVVDAMARLTAEQSAAAVDAARADIAHWIGVFPQDRTAVLRHYYKLFLENKEDLGPITAFDMQEELSTRANATEYGSMVYQHRQDPRRIHHVSRELNFGMVEVKRANATGALIPFYWMKQSGLGREGARAGMQVFVEIKYVCSD